jgi:hypothetical protein
LHEKYRVPCEVGDARDVYNQLLRKVQP